MVCQVKQSMINDIAKELIPELRKSFPEAKGPEIKRRSIAAATSIHEAAAIAGIQAGFDSKDLPIAVTANATTEVPSSLPAIEVSRDIAILVEVFKKDPTRDNYNNLISREIVEGLRNADGEQIAKVKPSSIKSGDTDMSSNYFEDYYVDTDGSINKSAALDKAFIELDKINSGSNFDEDHSAHLTKLVNLYTYSVQSLKDMELRIKKSTLRAVIEAEGYYSPDDQAMEIRVDTHGPGAEFRNAFTMTNQEVYAHELTHATLDYIWQKSANNVANDADIVAFTAALQALFDKAKKDSTWESLLPGYKDGVQYTSAEIASAKGTFDAKGKLLIQGKWDYIFNNKDGNGLQEFAAAILTNSNFKKAMDQFGSLATVKADKDLTLADNIRNWFNKILEKVFGLASSRRDNTISAEATSLLFKIMRANANAVDYISRKQGISNIAEGMRVYDEKVEIGNAYVRKFTDPFIGAFDAIEEAIGVGDKALEANKVEELIKLRDKIQVIMGDVTPKINRTVNLKNVMVGTITMLNILQKVIRVLPSIYRLRTLTKGSKQSKEAAKLYARTINKILTSAHLAQDGVVRNVVREFVSRPGMYNFLADSILKLTKSVDGMREETFEEVRAEIREGFGDVKIDNNRLNAKHNEALTYVILRTDIQSLGLDAEGLEELLRDPSNVSTKITELKDGLSATQVADCYSLAHYMVKGTGIASNAVNIANDFGAEQSFTATAAKIKQIDQLTSYIALSITDDQRKRDLLAFMRGDSYVDYSSTLNAKLRESLGIKSKRSMTKEEYITKVSEGINTFIDHSTGVQNASIKEMKDNPHNRIKGYIKETYDKDIVLEFHLLEDKDRLISEGYRFIKEVKQAKGVKEAYGMFISNSPALGRSNGALGLQDRRSRGFTLRDAINLEAERDDKPWEADKKIEAFKALLETTREVYIRDRSNLAMQPVYDSRGVIIDFRTTLTLDEKHEYLGMELNGDVSLARTYSTMGTATATTYHNKTVIDELFNDYRDNYNGTTASEYAIIEPEAASASAFGLPGAETFTNDYARFWARLPKETQAYAATLFGSKRIIIRKDLLAVAFGEDDYTLSQSRLVDKWTPKAKAKFAKAENVWKDVMGIAKDNIVIKTPEVFLGNVTSNFKILVYLGVNPIRGIKLLLTARRELDRYLKDSKELHKLYRMQNTGRPASEGRIEELKNSILLNSVTPLMDAGLYQSIVEDMDTAGDSNKVAKWFSDKTDKYIPNETINSIAQHLFLTKRTKPYQQLLKLTQVSDFYFRYAQYYDEIAKKELEYIKNNMPKEYIVIIAHTDANLREDEIYRQAAKIPVKVREAIRKKAMRNAIDNYINYEAPIQTHIKYGDSMGPFFFARYFIRIQKVIKKIAKENPLRMGADILLQTFITNDSADIQDASIFDKGLRAFYPNTIIDRALEAVTPAGLEVINTYT